MIYRGPGFLAVVWYGSPPLPLSPSCPSEARPATTRKTEKEEKLLTGEGKGVGEEQIIRQQQSLVFYKSFNTLWFDVYEYDEDEATVFPAVMIKKGRSGWGVLFPSIRYFKGICMQLQHILVEHTQFTFMIIQK